MADLTRSRRVTQALMIPVTLFEVLNRSRRPHRDHDEQDKSTDEACIPECCRPAMDGRAPPVMQSPRAPWNISWGANQFFKPQPGRDCSHEDEDLVSRVKETKAVAVVAIPPFALEASRFRQRL